MALPSSGTMAASMIQKELKESGSWSIDSPTSRKLAKVPSGTIKFSDFYGKANTETVTDYVLYQNSWTKPWELEFSASNLDGLPFNDTFKAPHNMINGKLIVDIRYTGEWKPIIKFKSFVEISNIGRVEFNSQHTHEVLTYNISNSNIQSFNIKGDVGCSYIGRTASNGTRRFISDEGIISVKATFTGEWEPNNL